MPRKKHAPDEIGVSPPLSPKFRNVSVPYGASRPRNVRGHSFMREIPQCWLTGHAASMAAAISVNSGV